MSIDNVKYLPPTPGTSSGSASIVVGSTTVGGESTLLIADMSSRELLGAILTELKKLNLRQQEAFEETVKDDDV